MTANEETIAAILALLLSFGAQCDRSLLLKCLNEAIADSLLSERENKIDTELLKGFRQDIIDARSLDPDNL